MRDGLIGYTYRIRYCSLENVLSGRVLESESGQVGYYVRFKIHDLDVLQILEQTTHQFQICGRLKRRHNLPRAVGLTCQSEGLFGPCFNTVDGGG